MFTENMYERGLLKFYICGDLIISLVNLLTVLLWANLLYISISHPTFLKMLLSDSLCIFFSHGTIKYTLLAIEKIKKLMSITRRQRMQCMK